MRLLFVVLLFLTTTFVAQAGDSLFVYGRVTANDSKEQLYQVNVFDKDRKVGVFTDKLGEYRFYVPDSLVGKKFFLTFQYPGYDEVRKRIRVKKGSKMLNVALPPTMIEIILTNR